MIPTVEVKFTDTRKPKLTVGSERITIKVNENSHVEGGLGQRIVEMATAARIIHEELSPIDRTYRGFFKFRPDKLVIALTNRNKTKDLFKSFQFPSKARTLEEENVPVSDLKPGTVVISEERMQRAMPGADDNESQRRTLSRKEFHDQVQKARDAFAALPERTRDHLRSTVASQTEREEAL